MTLRKLVSACGLSSTFGMRRRFIIELHTTFHQHTDGSINIHLYMDTLCTHCLQAHITLHTFHCEIGACIYDQVLQRERANFSVHSFMCTWYVWSSSKEATDHFSCSLKVWTLFRSDKIASCGKTWTSCGVTVSTSITEAHSYVIENARYIVHE